MHTTSQADYQYAHHFIGIFAVNSIISRASWTPTRASSLYVDLKSYFVLCTFHREFERPKFEHLGCRCVHIGPNLDRELAHHLTASRMPPRASSLTLT